MTVRVDNICGDFLALWEKAKDCSFLEQRQLWRTLYEAPHQDVFDLYYTRYGSPNQLEAAFTRFAEVVPKIRTISPHAEVTSHLIGPRSADLFEAKQWQLGCVLMVGLFSSDAWAIRFRNRMTTFVALEAQQSSRLQDLEITIAHETAHSMHSQCSPFDVSTTAVAEGLFSEGLAVLASSVLVPQAPEAAYLCPGGIRTLEGQDCAEWVAECRQLWPELRQRLMQDLDRTDVSCFASYFWGGRHQSDTAEQRRIPRRTGYVVGYSAVRVLNQRHTVAAMARWSPQRAITEVRHVLEQMTTP